jgi:hypothetical protein
MFIFLLSGVQHIQPLTVSANPYSSYFQLPSLYEDCLLHPKRKNTFCYGKKFLSTNVS